MEFERVGEAVVQRAKKPIRVTVVRAMFRDELTRAMQTEVEKRAPNLNASITATLLARGVLETPFLAQHAFAQKDVDAVVVLGAVLRGSTDHDRVVVEQATRALVELSLQHQKPVGIGIIGPGVDELRARERVREYAAGALDAVVASFNAVNGNG